MPLPLYRGLDAPARPDTGAHMGLWFERYFSAYDPEFRAQVELSKSEKENLQKQRGQWLKTCTRNQHGDQRKLLDKAVRQLEMVRSFGGDARVFRCAGRFVSGIGNAHPLENGFTWHPTLGMPYLPGSAVKGLVRAVVETALDAGPEEKARILRLWFGTEQKGDVAEQAGAFIFLDAIPVAPCELRAEVLTPHMGNWYEKGQKTPMVADTMPGDWHSPVPVLWLAASDLRLQFAVMPRPGAQASLDDLWEALDYGLQYLGAGAKTAIGFGLFSPDSQGNDVVARQLRNHQEAMAEQQRRQALASASEEQRCILELGDYLESLPDRMPASDARTPELWQRLEAAIALLTERGDASQKAELHALIKGARDRKFIVSNKREKEFKALLARLNT